jgi:hypothetical protein
MAGGPHNHIAFPSALCTQESVAVSWASSRAATTLVLPPPPSFRTCVVSPLPLRLLAVQWSSFVHPLLFLSPLVPSPLLHLWRSPLMAASRRFSSPRCPLTSHLSPVGPQLSETCSSSSAALFVQSVHALLFCPRPTRQAFRAAPACVLVASPAQGISFPPLLLAST